MSGINRLFSYDEVWLVEGVGINIDVNKLVVVEIKVGIFEGIVIILYCEIEWVFNVLDDC